MRSRTTSVSSIRRIFGFSREQGIRSRCVSNRRKGWTGMAPHPQRLTVTRRSWPLARPFATALGVMTATDIVVAELSDGDSRGRGEGVPLRRYGESIDSVVGTLDAMKNEVFSGLNRETLQHALPPGAARNALDCAFWDIDAKRAYSSVAEMAGLGAATPVM